MPGTHPRPNHLTSSSGFQLDGCGGTGRWQRQQRTSSLSPGVSAPPPPCPAPQPTEAGQGRRCGSRVWLRGARRGIQRRARAARRPLGQVAAPEPAAARPSPTPPPPGHAEPAPRPGRPAARGPGSSACAAASNPRRGGAVSGPSAARTHFFGCFSLFGLRFRA